MNLCGVPPSTAISFKCRSGRCSLSKAFCSTISTFLLPSVFTCCFSIKLSFGDKT
uniref:Uncharacterized protein n=1 Tax=Xiphophorus couchianus TaxID=32473 RepID=A0A3B5MCZ7_9TELE